MEYNCEVGFISKLIETKDAKVISDNQIKTSFFTGGNKRVFSYILKHVQKYGEIPTVRVIEQKFPDYELYSHKPRKSKIRRVGTDESMSFWVDELRQKVRQNKLADILTEAADNLDALKTEEAYAELRRSFAELDSETNVTTSVMINERGEERKEAYRKRTESGGMLGISTGFGLLDYVTKGLIDDCLITIVGSTGVGKTFFEVLLGANAVLQNCTVAHFVTEMSTGLMQDRYDAILFSKLHKRGMNYKLFKSGKLTKEMEDEYFYFLDEELPNLEPLYIETATGVMALEQRVKEINPDLILVDGAYLMEDDQNAKDDWLRVAHITRDLKKLAKRIHKPIVINSQLDEKTAKKLSPKLGDIKYTQAIGQDSDIVIFMVRDEAMINDREMLIIVGKNREGEGGAKITYAWDFSDMNFSEIYSDVDTSGKDDSISSDSEGTLSMDEVDNE